MPEQTRSRWTKFYEEHTDLEEEQRVAKLTREAGGGRAVSSSYGVLADRLMRGVARSAVEAAV